MEDGPDRRINASDEQAGELPPPPPDPNVDADAAIVAAHPSFLDKSDDPLKLSGPEWDVTAISALGALRMLMGAMDMLADATGDIPPTPPISRPTTPRVDKRTPLASSSRHSAIPDITIGSPEAHPHEAIRVIGKDAEEHTIQHAAIARRFFSKVIPPFSLEAYLLRLHHWCPHSPGVYLAAASYCHRLCVAEYLVPATKRTIHRLSLAAIRIAAKALEDSKWSQDRISKVGGVSHTQLKNLEVSLCFLLDFDLWVDATTLANGMFLLQQGGRQGAGARGKLSDFRLRLPLTKQKKILLAAA